MADLVAAETPVSPGTGQNAEATGNQASVAGGVNSPDLRPGVRPAARNWIDLLPEATPMPDRMCRATLPVANLPAVGFQVDCRLITAPDPGFATVRLTFRPAGPLPADRPLELSVRSIDGGYSPPRYGIDFRTDVALPQGMGNRTFDFLIPKPNFGTGIRVKLSERGEAIEGYTVDLGGLLSPIGQIPAAALTNELQMSVCFLHDDRADLPGGASGLQSKTNGWGSGRSVIRYYGGGGGYYSTTRRSNSNTQIVGFKLSADQALTDWRQYQAYDLVCAQASTLDDLDRRRPASARALRRWIHGGGTLVVLGREPSKAAVSGGLVETYRGRRFDPLSEDPRYAELSKRLRFAGGGEGGNGVTGVLKDRPALKLSPLGGGAVIRIAKLSGSDADAILRFVGFRISPTLRRGIDPIVGDRRFYRWLVPGVAQPPVYTFMGLLTIFVVLVGPVAYRRTSRLGRSYLMFLIAPVLAIATTLAMFAYGIFADGFSTRVRVRQLTWVDGPSGSVMEQTRATYFAGIRPSGGIDFPSDGETFEYRDSSEAGWSELATERVHRHRRVTLRDGKYNYESGFLPSRKQCQFVTLSPRDGLGRIVLTSDAPTVRDTEPVRAAAFGGQPRVTNEFDFGLDFVIVRDSAGRHWMAKNLEPGETTDGLNRVTQALASRRLGDLYNKHRLLADAEPSTRRRGRRSINDLSSVIASNVGQVGMVPTEGLFELALQRQIQSGSMSKGSFIAFTKPSADSIALSQARPVASVRIVFGTLP